MPTTPNPEIALLDQKLNDIDGERQQVHQAYIVAHAILHDCGAKLPGHLRRFYLVPSRDLRKRSAARMETLREKMDDLISQRIEIKGQVSAEVICF